jgi:hypothetical protein
MSDEVTEVTSKGWLQRIRESIKGVLMGAVLFLVAPPVLWWNEGRSVQTYKSLKEGRGSVVSVASEGVDAANEGALVHTTGQAVTEETLADPVFGAAANALRLSRKGRRRSRATRSTLARTLPPRPSGTCASPSPSFPPPR